MWKCTFVALSLLCFAYTIQVPIVVKDTSGYGATSFPTSVVIPLPYGAYQSTSSFRLSDSSHTTIPCQFVVQSRWAAKDNSIRHVVAHFSATVAPYTGEGTGTTTIYFSDDGNGDVAPASNAVTITDNSGTWTISNGLVSLQVAQSSFTTISSLTLNGNSILTSSGASLLDRLGNTQLDSALPVYTAEIEESGPIRTVVKVTAKSTVACSQYKDEVGLCTFPLLHCVDGEQVQVQHGYAVRIYAYAGVEFVKVDYQLQNSPYSDVVNGYPLYFEELKLSFSLNLDTATSKVTVGLGNNTVWSKSLTSNGFQLYQDFPTVSGNVFRIRDATSKAISVTGAESDGFVDVSDSSKGVLAFIRNFWQSWPNAISAKIASSKVALDVELFPKDGTMLVYGGTPDASGLYWLDDMQHVYKEFYLYPHSSSLTSANMISIANTFQWYPVAVVPTSWYRTTSVSLGLGGHLPNQEDPTDYDTVRNLKQEQLDSVVGTYSNLGTNGYEFHWRHLGSFDAGYRDTSCTTGSWPYSVGGYVVTGNPRDYFWALEKGAGEINTRPQWMGPDYKYNVSMPWNFPGAYCGGSWRWWCGNQGGDQYLTSLLDSSNKIINPRDDEHAWHYHAYESYEITGNLWIKDWYKFVGEFRMSRLHEEYVPYPDLSSRATGHALNHAIQAFRVTGDLEITKGFVHNILNFRLPYLDPRYGDNQEYYESSGGGYQTGYYMRAIVDYLEEISDPQAWAEGFQLLSALVAYNQKFSHFSYYYQPATEPEGTYGASSSGSETCADPLAWYYYHTGIEEYREIIIQFQETGVPGFDGTNTVAGTLPYYRLNQTWTGDYMGRITPDLWNATKMSHDTRPTKIVDLAAYLNDGTMHLLWTTPANAAKFHIVWSDRPISEEHTIDNNTYCNWWAAHAIGTSMTASPESQQTVAFTVNGTTDYYIAMFAWDSIGNISPMSNVAKSTNDTFPGVSTTGGGSSTTAGNNPNPNDDDNVNVGEIVKPLFIVVLSLVFILFN